MIEHVIFFRQHGGTIETVYNEAGGVHVFHSKSAAQDYADRNALMQAVGYQIVALDEI